MSDVDIFVIKIGLGRSACVRSYNGRIDGQRVNVHEWYSRVLDRSSWLICSWIIKRSVMKTIAAVECVWLWFSEEFAFSFILPLMIKTSTKKNKCWLLRFSAGWWYSKCCDGQLNRLWIYLFVYIFVFFSSSASVWPKPNFRFGQMTKMISNFFNHVSFFLLIEGKKPRTIKLLCRIVDLTVVYSNCVVWKICMQEILSKWE